MRDAAEAGVELPSYETEEFGGYAYEAFLLSLLVRPEPHLIGDELDEFFERTFGRQSKRLEEIMQPTRRDHIAHRELVNAYRMYKRFGFPESGGWKDQSAHWLYVMNCAITAEERAESHNMREEAAYNKQKADQAKEDVPSS